MGSPAVVPARPSRPPTELLALLAFCGFLLFFGLGAFGLVGADEPRYAQIAREMLARHDWITPVLNGRPWLEKPVLYYWEAMISYSLFGVSDWAARIPSAFSATTMIIAIYIFWRRVAPPSTTRIDPRAEHDPERIYGSGFSPLDAALITLSTAAVIGFGRAASTDMPLAANFTIAMLCWIARYAEPDRPGDGPSRFHPRLLLFYVFLALATLAKGPVAPGLAAIIIVVFAFVRRESAVIRRTLWLPGILVYLAVAAPWYWLVQQHTGNFFRVFFFEHNLERFGTNVFRHPQPFWYYIPVTLAALTPWIIWCAVAIWRGFWSLTPLTALYSYTATNPADAKVLRLTETGYRDPHRDALRIFLTIWALVPVIFFSFSQSKLPGYILPAVPAWTLLTALVLERIAERTRRVAVVLHSAVCALLVGAVVVSPYLVMKLPVARFSTIVAAVAALAIFVGLLLTLRRGNAMLRFATLVPVLIAVAYLLRITAPAIEATQSARPVAQKLAAMQSQAASMAVFHVKRDTEYGLNFYRNQAISSYDRAEIPAEDHLVVARDGSEHELADLAGGRRVVRLGSFPAQNLEFFWITSAANHMH